MRSRAAIKSNIVKIEKKQSIDTQRYSNFEGRLWSISWTVVLKTFIVQIGRTGIQVLAAADTLSPPLGCEWSRNRISNFCPGRGLNPGPRSLMAVNATTRLRGTPITDNSGNKRPANSCIHLTISPVGSVCYFSWASKGAFNHFSLKKSIAQ